MGLTLAQAERAADDLRELFDACLFNQWIVSGQARRRQPDVERLAHVVVMDDPTPLLVRIKGLIANGTLLAPTDPLVLLNQSMRHQTHFLDGVEHDIHITSAARVGVVLLATTGPRSFARRVYAALRDKGFAIRAGLTFGCLESPDNLDLSTEEAIFAAAGLACVPPEQRS